MISGPGEGAVTRTVVVLVALLTVTAMVGPVAVGGATTADATITDGSAGIDATENDDVDRAAGLGSGFDVDDAVATGDDGSETTDGVGENTPSIGPDARNASGTTRLIVRFTEPDTAGLAAANGAVSTTDLKSHAGASQSGFEAFADGNPHVEIERSFWIANAMLVEVNLDRLPVERLLEVHGVERVHDNFAMELNDARAVDTPTGPSPIAPGAVVAQGDDATAGDVTPPRLTTDGVIADQVTTSSVDATYGVEMVRAPEVWETFGTRGEGATVAVIDTGIDPNHPDLDVSAWAEFDENGHLVSDDLGDADDGHGHGTHVAGTVAGGNASGTAIGVAPDATLHGIKALDDDGSGTFAQILAGMEHATDDDDVDVLQMSLGTPGTSSDLIDPVRNARAADKLVVASSGNSENGSSSSPGNVFDSFAVGAVDSDRNVPGFSSGETINTNDAWGEDAPDDWPDEYVVPDASAPGVDVFSAEPDGKYTHSSGTSMAAPHVSGAAALVISATDGSIDDEQLYDVLRETADHPDGDVEPDTGYGTGIVDAYAATMNAAEPAVSIATDGPEYVEANSSFEVELTVANAKNYTPTVAASQHLGSEDLSIRVLEVDGESEPVSVGDTVDLTGLTEDVITIEVIPESRTVGTFALTHEIGGSLDRTANVTTSTTKTHPDPFAHPAVTPPGLNDSVADVLAFTVSNTTVHLEAGIYDEAVGDGDAALVVDDGRTLGAIPSAETTPTINVTDEGAAVTLGDGATLDDVDLVHGGIAVDDTADATVTNVTVTDADEGLHVGNATNATATDVTLAGVTDAVAITEDATGTTAGVNVTHPDATVRFGAVDPDANAVAVDMSDGRTVDVSGRNATLANGSDPGVGSESVTPIGAFLELNADGDDPQLSLGVEYADAEIEGLREETLELFRYDESAEELESIAESDVDAANRTVSTTVGGFGTFGVYAEPKQAFFDLDDLDDLDVPGFVEREETLSVTATVENVGDADGEDDVELRLGDVDGDAGSDYELLDETRVSLNDSESTPVTLSGTVPDDFDIGNVTVAVVSSDDDARNSILVVEAMGAVNGTVTDDESGGPLDDATITVERNGTFVGETETDDDGNYSVEVPTGDLSVTASAVAAESDTKSATLDESGEVAVDFALVPLPWFVVTDVDGPSEIEQGESGEFTVTVRNDGRIEGNATVLFTVEGSDTKSEPVSGLGPDETASVTFEHAVDDDASPGDYGVTVEPGDDQRTETVTVVEKEEEESETSDDSTSSGGGGDGGSGGDSGGGDSGGGDAPDSTPTPTEEPEETPDATPTPTEEPTETPDATPTPTEEPEAAPDDPDGSDAGSPTTEPPAETDDSADETPVSTPEPTDDDVPGFGTPVALLAVTLAALLAGRRNEKR